MNGWTGQGDRQTPFTHRLLVWGFGLILLFTALSPQASQPLTLLPRALFWGLHIGLGLATAGLAAQFLVRRTRRFRDWRLVLASGVLGLFMFAPLAFGLEALFPLAADGADGDWSDRFARTSTVAAILIEGWELAPAYLSAWMLINLAPLGPVLSGHRSVGRDEESAGTASDGLPDGARIDGSVAQAADIGNDAGTEIDTRKTPTEASAFLDRLPPVIGRDLISVSSDLHYLQVTTQKGKATVLGALQEVEDAFGEAGLRVHRSHWVALDAVVRLRKISSGWQLELSGDYRVPVSRRKKALVLERLGEDFTRLSKTV